MRRDVVTAFFERLGNAGILLLAVALLAGGLAGAAITHHYEQISSSSVAADHQKQKGPGAQKPPKNKGQGKQGHSNKPPQTHSPDVPDQPETD